MQHVIVYAKQDRFAAWPANNGVWQWDDEILVGLTDGPFEEKQGHNINGPYASRLARSTDGGNTWCEELPANYVQGNSEPTNINEKIEFMRPGFVLRVIGVGYFACEHARGAFYFSYDRGRQWRGPFALPTLADHPQVSPGVMTPRTDYIVNGPHDCTLLLSARGMNSVQMDRVFCARTTDGGQSFRFVSWMVPPTDPHRAVMSSTVKFPSESKVGQNAVENDVLVSAVRRRRVDAEECWIDTYVSSDEAVTWQWAGKVASTGQWNGNPPALARLADGRLCCVYGQRDPRIMAARFSSDRGCTWSNEIVLRDDFQADRFDEPDLGYPRLVQRSDGKLVAIYYWATKYHPQQHIAATIWSP